MPEQSAPTEPALAFLRHRSASDRHDLVLDVQLVAGTGNWFGASPALAAQFAVPSGTTFGELAEQIDLAYGWQSEQAWQLRLPVDLTVEAVEVFPWREQDVVVDSSAAASGEGRVDAAALVGQTVGLRAAFWYLSGAGLGWQHLCRVSRAKQGLFQFNEVTCLSGPAATVAEPVVSGGGQRRSR